MEIDPHLWDALQAHGVTEAHLDMLLRLLQLQKNGAWSWHFAHGQLSQVDLRLVCRHAGMTWHGLVRRSWAGSSAAVGEVIQRQEGGYGFLRARPTPLL